MSNVTQNKTKQFKSKMSKKLKKGIVKKKVSREIFLESFSGIFKLKIIRNFLITRKLVEIMKK